MIKITAHPFFWTTATFKAPDDNGEMQDVKLRVKLAYKDDKGYQDLLYTQAPQQPDGTGDSWLAKQVTQGWEAEKPNGKVVLADVDGKALPFSVDALDALLNAHKPAASAIVRAWIAGQVGAAQGN